MIDNYKPEEWYTLYEAGGHAESADAEYAKQLTAKTGEFISQSRVKGHRHTIGQKHHNQPNKTKRRNITPARGLAPPGTEAVKVNPPKAATIAVKIGGKLCEGTPQALQALLGI